MRIVYRDGWSETWPVGTWVNYTGTGWAYVITPDGVRHEKHSIAEVFAV